jgi:hypothetical protein
MVIRARVDFQMILNFFSISFKEFYFYTEFLYRLISFMRYTMLPVDGASSTVMYYLYYISFNFSPLEI